MMMTSFLSTTTIVVVVVAAMAMVVGVGLVDGAMTTPYPGFGGGGISTTYYSFFDNYLGINVLTGQAPVTMTTNPKTKASSSLTSLAWSASKSRPTVSYTLCDYVSIKSVSFDVSNVKAAGIFVDSTSYYGAVDANKHVEIKTGNDKYSKRVGSVVKITLTPINYTLPVAISNVAVYSWGVSDDCFVDCAVYIMETDSGCYKPICNDDPCENLACPDDMECRLVPLDKKTTYLPDLVAYGAQVWECVDKSRTDYGCHCQSGKYEQDHMRCPTCQCTP